VPATAAHSGSLLAQAVQFVVPPRACSLSSRGLHKCQLSVPSNNATSRTSEGIHRGGGRDARMAVGSRARLS